MNPKLLFRHTGPLLAGLFVTLFAFCLSIAPTRAQSGGPGTDHGTVTSIDDMLLEIRGGDGTGTRTYKEAEDTRWLDKSGQPIDPGDVVDKKVAVRFQFVTGGMEALSVQLSSGAKNASADSKAANSSSKSSGGAPSNKSSMDGKDTAVDAHEFVQKFYNWYVPFSAHSKTLACKEVLKTHPEYFSKALGPALKKNITEMEKTGGLGLDFDPFLNSQDPASKYVVGPADGTDEGYAMEVYSVQDGHKQSEPDVIAVVENQHNSWVLTNFHYPNLGKSLRQLLQE